MKKHILKIIALLSFAFFFFPFFIVSYGYKKISFSGLDLATGRNGAEFVNGHAFIFLLLVLPIAFLAISFYANKWERISSLTFSIISIFVLLVISAIVGGAEKKIGFDVVTKSGFFLYLLSIAASIGYILYEYLFVVAKEPSADKAIYTPSKAMYTPKSVRPINIYEKFLEFNKMKNLFTYEIYNLEEFTDKKSKWIGSLGDYSFESVEMDFLSELLPYIKENVISQEELTRIKYLISEEYVETRDRSAILQKQAEQENTRTERQEAIENIKNKTKNTFTGAFSKVKEVIYNIKNSTTSAMKGPRCECGEPLDGVSIFCTMCGRKTQ